jgi:hypothetical protein
VLLVAALTLLLCLARPHDYQTVSQPLRYRALRHHAKVVGVTGTGQCRGLLLDEYIVRDHYRERHLDELLLQGRGQELLPLERLQGRSRHCHTEVSLPRARAVRERIATAPGIRGRDRGVLLGGGGIARAWIAGGKGADEFLGFVPTRRIRLWYQKAILGSSPVDREVLVLKNYAPCTTIIEAGSNRLDEPIHTDGVIAESWSRLCGSPQARGTTEVRA